MATQLLPNFVQVLGMAGQLHRTGHIGHIGLLPPQTIAHSPSCARRNA